MNVDRYVCMHFFSSILPFVSICDQESLYLGHIYSSSLIPFSISCTAYEKNVVKRGIQLFLCASRHLELW